MFSDRGVKMLVKCLQICAHVFIDRPQNCAQTSFRSCAGLRPNFGHSRAKLCQIMCHSRTKLCPNFGRSRARLCPISFAPCPFPNLAGTLHHDSCWPYNAALYRHMHYYSVRWIMAVFISWSAMWLERFNARDIERLLTNWTCPC